MATTVKELSALLDQMKLNYKEQDDGALTILMRMKNYRDADGDEGLFIVIQLLEDGEYLRVFCPLAYKVSGPHTDIALRVCGMIQWQTKLIQYEYDHTDGELRPIVEFPLEDATLTFRQLKRCVMALCHLVDTYHSAIQRALEDGVVDLPELKQPGATDSGTTTRMLELTLQMMIAQGRAESDPQVQALRAMLGPASSGAPTEL